MYSTLGVTNSARAFKYDRVQFSRMLKEVGITALIKISQIEETFNTANRIKWRKMKTSHELMPKSGKSALEGILENMQATEVVEETEESDAVLDFDEFIEAMMHIGKIIYPEETVTQRWVHVMHDHIEPAVGKYDMLGHGDQLGMIPEEEEEEVKKTMKEHRKKLKTLFNWYASGDETPAALNTQSAEELSMIDTKEFLLLAKQCKFPQCGLSYSQCLQVFIQSNEEEITEFLSGADFDDLAEALQMDFDEFLQSLFKFTTIIFRQYTGVKKKTFNVVLNEFCEKIFHEAPARLRLTVR